MTDNTRDDLRYCTHKGEGSWWEYDARGIELCKVYNKCQAAKLAEFRRDVLTNPSYAADEPIEPEEYPACPCHDQEGS